MNIDQIETIGEEAARITKVKFSLDYIRFDAGTAAFDPPLPWATLFVAKRGYVSHRHHEFPTAQVHQWLAMSESQAREALCIAFEGRTLDLVQETTDLQQLKKRHVSQQPSLQNLSVLPLLSELPRSKYLVPRGLPIIAQWCVIVVVVITIGLLLAQYLGQQISRGHNGIA
jgi:hypothetical protein